MNNIELTFTVTYEEANIIVAGLQELPAKVCNPLTQKLQEQAKPQLSKLTDEDKKLEVVK